MNRFVRFNRRLPMLCFLSVMMFAVTLQPAISEAKKKNTKVREYWIAADEVLWDYAPSFPINRMTDEEFTEDQRVFVEEGIGRTYLESIYREYTPDFAALKPQSDEHLGTLGPIIRAAVVDLIVVHFRNNTQHPATVHPHGVFYSKDSEGAPYAGI